MPERSGLTAQQIPERPPSPPVPGPEIMPPEPQPPNPDIPAPDPAPPPWRNPGDDPPPPLTDPDLPDEGDPQDPPIRAAASRDDNLGIQIDPALFLQLKV